MTCGIENNATGLVKAVLAGPLVRNDCFAIINIAAAKF
jgi:hypothetical protein